MPGASEQLPSTSNDAAVDVEQQRQAERKGLLEEHTERIPWYPYSRKYSTQEIFLDTFVNALGIVAIAAGIPFLLHKSVSGGDDAAKILGLAVYGLGTMSMMTASFLFNRYPWREDWYDFLFFMDVSSINIMIASCYTPVAIQARCYKLTTCVWCLAGVGILWQCAQFGIHFKKRYKVELVLFLLMGWIIVAFRHEITPYFHAWCTHIAMIFGVIYSIGAIFNAWEGLEFHKPIWHTCVLIATSLTYVVAYVEIAGGAPRSQIVRAS